MLTLEQAKIGIEIRQNASLQAMSVWLLLSPLPLLRSLKQLETLDCGSFKLFGKKISPIGVVVWKR